MSSMWLTGMGPMKKRLEVRYRCSGVACCYVCQYSTVAGVGRQGHARRDTQASGRCTSLETGGVCQAGTAMTAGATRALGLLSRLWCGDG